MTRLDRARARFPLFGFAVYALRVGGPVTIEVHLDNGDVLSKEAATEADAWEMLMGPEEEPAPAAEVEDPLG